MLRFNEDKRSLTFLTIHTCFMIWVLFIHFNQLTFIEYFILVIGGGLMGFSVSLINHNHRHNEIFLNPKLNRLTNIWISILIGAPSTRLHLVHNFNHHKFYPSHEDWSHFETNTDGVGFKRLINYIINSTIKMNKNRDQLVDTEDKKKMLIEERIGLYLFIALALWINFKIFLFMILPVWMIGFFFLISSNILNHDLCDQDNSINNSRDFISPMENWWFCNNGYHTAHHLKADLHWSKLPRLHRDEVVPKKNKQLIEESFFSYFWNYVTWNPSIQRKEVKYLIQKSKLDQR
jgi:beta-carotene hydroxylase